MGNPGESCKAAVFQPHPLHIQCHRSPFHHNYHQHPLPYDASATVDKLVLDLTYGGNACTSDGAHIP